MSLLRGFGFHCRSDCGLCCFAAPAVSPTERTRLLQIDPEMPCLEGDGGGEGSGPTQIASRPDGGACHFLQNLRCRVHAARPFPCRTFPIVVHMDPERRRAQATLVLSCPGLDLGALASWAGPAPPTAGPRGLDEEIRAVTEELREVATREGAPSSGRKGKVRRRAGPKGLGEEEWASSRDQTLARIPMPGFDDFPASSPPGGDAPLESLPLFFDDREGRVAMRGQEGGWELLSLEETGGIRESLGLFPEIVDPPRLTPGAQDLLRGYLAYSTRRDFLRYRVGWVLQEEGRSDVEGVAGELLRELGSQVLARGGVRAMLEGRGTSRLEEGDVARGIMAVDADFLDQPFLGGQL